MSGLDLERLVLSGGPLGLMQSAFDVRFLLPLSDVIENVLIDHICSTLYLTFTNASSLENLSALSSSCKERLPTCTPR
jgi:hypothetical protein